MLLSIIIPTYNRSGLIKFTLDSLAAHHHPGVKLEVIVVDDNSSDNTCSFIEQSYPHVRLFRNDKKGVAAARNKGLAMASGKYVMYLDSDDLTGERFFAEKIAFLEKNDQYHACYGEYEFFSADDAFSEKDIIFRYKYPMLSGEHSARQHLANFLSGNFIPPHAIVWRKSFLEKIKGHDETLTINQDVELFIRAIFNGLRIMAITDGTKAYVRQHEIDKRVGNPRHGSNKWKQILDLRKQIFKDLKVYDLDQAEFHQAMSSYLFNYWRLLRHSDPELAKDFLDFAKSIHWPVQIKGSMPFRFLSAVLGPVNAVEVKYFLLKRD